ncbi:aspartate aminotransferase [Leisingera caerulea]|uniref:aspartate aminotransferase n=1 Tax=Leisingera caerulea TaxID=506591 RepID=UPI0021A8E90D|nr:aspartate aminotransferase [Leisingera caerulea]
MVKPGSALSPDIWLRDIFACKAVQSGQLLRRKIRDIERYAGMDAFLAEVRPVDFRRFRTAGRWSCCATPPRSAD